MRIKTKVVIQPLGVGTLITVFAEFHGLACRKMRRQAYAWGLKKAEEMRIKEEMTAAKPEIHRRRYGYFVRIAGFTLKQSDEEFEEMIENGTPD